MVCARKEEARNESKFKNVTEQCQSLPHEALDLPPAHPAIDSPIAARAQPPLRAWRALPFTGP